MKKNRLRILGAVLLLIILIFFGIFYFHLQEGWSYVDAFYFVIMTITSVGYGDVVPKSDISKIVTAVYAIIAIPVVFLTLGMIAKSYFEVKIATIERRISQIASMEKEIEGEVEKLKENSANQEQINKPFWRRLFNI
jgi:CBS domain containing-hemolysin-like protein